MTTSSAGNTIAATGISAEAQALLTTVQSAMPGALIPSLATPQGRGALYEVYAWCMTWQAARDAGADRPVFCTRNGVPATAPYTFRLSPSNLRANDPFTYAVLTFTQLSDAKKSLEVHLGIYLCGPSAQRVQSDVCVLSQEEADYFRTQPVRTRRGMLPRYWPDARHTQLTIECKCLASNMRSRLVHEVLGRFQELRTAKNRALMVNTRSQAAERRVVGTFGDAAWQNEVVPTNQAQEQSCREMLRTVFRSYIRQLSNYQ